MRMIEHVLVVDDDEIYQFIIKREIEATKMVKRISLINDGDEAIQYLEKNIKQKNELPDIILLDINMNKMDGWDFLQLYKSFKSELAKIPSIYLVSSSINERDDVKSKEYEDLLDYIIKPVKKERLINIFTKYLNTD
jgi:CheY-like chemotaxis protein